MLTTTRKIIILSVFFIITSLAWVSSQSTCNGTIHVVQRGENLFRISLNYGVDLNTTAQLNGITDTTQIFAGQSLCMPTYGTNDAIPVQSISQNTTSQTTISISTVGYFVPCAEGVECVVDQTQVHFHEGQNRCVSAKLTENGLGWVPAEPEWCNWTDVLTSSWDGVGQGSTTIVTTTNDESTSDDASSNDNSSDGSTNAGADNLCFNGNAWAGQCDSDFMWKAGFFYSQYLSGQISISEVPGEFSSLAPSLGITITTTTSDDDDSDDDDDNDDDSDDDDDNDDDSDDNSNSSNNNNTGNTGNNNNNANSGNNNNNSGNSGNNNNNGNSGNNNNSGNSGNNNNNGNSGSVTANDCRNNASVLPLGSAPSVSDNASGLLTLVNWARNYCGGLSPLSLSSQLNTASQLHSQDMADRDYFSHTAQAPAPNGSSAGQRAANAGYNSYSGENIAAGNSGVVAAFGQWWNSNGHRNNILGSHTQMGHGYGFNASSTYRHYHTQMFGRG